MHYEHQNQRETGLSASLCVAALDGGQQSGNFTHFLKPDFSSNLTDTDHSSAATVEFLLIELVPGDFESVGGVSKVAIHRRKSNVRLRYFVEVPGFICRAVCWV